MPAILKREVRNYLKRPMFWLGIVVVFMGVFHNVRPYLDIHYLAKEEKIEDDTPAMIHEGEVYEGYVPSTKEERRKIWEEEIQRTLISEYKVDQKKAENIIHKIKNMDLWKACEYVGIEYGYDWPMNLYYDTTYHRGTSEEINSYIMKKLQNKTFSFYFSRKFADFAGLYMCFFASLLLSVLFLQDTRKSTYELLHTKSISAGKYMFGKAGGGFAICFIVIAILNLVFWIICKVCTRSSGFEVRLFDFIKATCLYILPNIVMIVSIYGLISLIFRNPLPAVPFLILYIVYSNMGSRNSEGVFGYYGRPLAIMVRFPGQFFDTDPPPMVRLNQSFLIVASIVIVLISINMWKRRRI